MAIKIHLRAGILSIHGFRSKKIQSQIGPYMAIFWGEEESLRKTTS